MPRTRDFNQFPDVARSDPERARRIDGAKAGAFSAAISPRHLDAGFCPKHPTTSAAASDLRRDRHADQFRRGQGHR